MRLIGTDTGGLVRQRPGTDEYRSPFVVVSGAASEGLDRVAEALAGAGVPFVHADPSTNWPAAGAAAVEDAAVQDGAVETDTGENATAESAAPAQVASAVVLIDPGPADWRIVDAVGAPSLLVLFHEPDLSEIADALLRGMRSMVRGNDVGANLAAVVALVAQGYFAMPTEHLDDLVRWLGLPGERAAVPELTTREADILGSIALGHTVRQTARSLGIAVKTVENTQARLFRKLGAHNRSGALTIAYRMGLVDPAEGGGGPDVATAGAVAAPGARPPGPTGPPGP